ncbi:MAG: isocitrate lyase/phosphoenolpyruvate mutase family protein [Microthrixaceae bacterium]|nr:isocitrate lyase/phosphoenolpyruvate mutase family protein [Microthrixaceae bacterium]
MDDADDPTAQQLRGKRFRELHDMGTFLMANVVDAATARALGDTGVRAIATSSAAHAATLGRHDAAGKVSLEEHAEHTALICAGTELPVNVDAENGYGHEPEEVAHCIRRLAETGAVGAGIEDWSGDPDIGFYSVARATERIAAAVEAAEALDVTSPSPVAPECLLYEHRRHGRNTPNGSAPSFRSDPLPLRPPAPGTSPPWSRWSMAPVARSTSWPWWGRRRRPSRSSRRWAFGGSASDPPWRIRRSRTPGRWSKESCAPAGSTDSAVRLTERFG